MKSQTELVGIDYLIEISQVYLKDQKQMEIYLPKMINILKDEFNSMLMKVSPLGLDKLGKQVFMVPDSWISEADTLYQILDEEEKGSLDADRV